MITIENISLSYGLAQVDCHIPQGKLIGIMGANGAGKSTLLKAIAGILPLKHGQIWLNSHKLSDMNVKQKSQHIAYLAQQTDLRWELSVYDVIALGLLSPLKQADEQRKVRSVSDKFSLAHLLNKPFQQLSGGEKTRVQLARCCIKDSPILLADEPIAALDPYYQIDIMEQLKALTPERTCVIVIHHLSLAYRFCDQIILLKNGEVIAHGETQTVLNTENLAKGFGIRAEVDKENKEIIKINKLS